MRFGRRGFTFWIMCRAKVGNENTMYREYDRNGGCNDRVAINRDGLRGSAVIMRPVDPGKFISRSRGRAII